MQKRKLMRKSMLIVLAVLAAGLSMTGVATVLPVRLACAQQPHMSYAEDIAPIFRGWCASCHQPGGEGFNASGFDVTSYDTVMKGTKFGPMIIAGQPDTSNLIVLIEGRAQIKMPYGHKALPACLRQNIWSWIFDGAKNN
jgi:mono/diheme cytochrome c family protein